MIEKAKKAFNDNNLELAEQLLNRLLIENPDSVEALLLRSQVYHKQQKWGPTINDLNRVLELDPDNILAKNYKEITKQIISFWNKDSYNP
jgi:lipopolysaccharide biosynthesis regulator YciM